jgi:hypothetical protein
MAVKKIKIVEDNTAPAYLLTAQREGVAIDLTGCTVALIIAKGSTITNTGHQACTLVAPTSGRVQYSPQAGDFATPGTYKADLKITYGDGSIETMRDQLKFQVRRKIQ